MTHYFTKRRRDGVIHRQRTRTAFYPHDWPGTVFLGTRRCRSSLHPRRRQLFDLYWAADDGVEPNLIARYGEDACEYMSGLVFGWRPDRTINDSPLVVARVLAEARGLDVRREPYAGRLTVVEGVVGSIEDAAKLRDWIRGAFDEPPPP